MIKPEDLKRLAEYIGKENVFIHNDGKRVRCREIRQGSFFTIDYNPLTNNDQDSEIEIKFKFVTEPVNDGWEAYIPYKNIEGKGSTPSEARLNAAIAALPEE